MGLVPSWAKDLKIGNRLINARTADMSTGAKDQNSFQWSLLDHSRS
ncbi:putative SOS response-associated peptidase YedK [Pseudonocardia eucalypti]|nr:putative SOS response-associated peptidase YedK [Pseudonocardia eucalypti]